jgi:hypothetical protein
VVNVVRHATALRPFRTDEFGTGPEAPTEAHVQGANRLITGLRRGLAARTRQVAEAASRATTAPTPDRLAVLLRAKDLGHERVRAVEKVWDFYFELFGQRQSAPYGTWLLACDRIALSCYQAAYLGVGVAKPVPAPPPFSYMRTGFSPATFRRGIRLTALGKRVNPFPLVHLPYHRLVNPWTLGAVLHEVSHNLQTDLGLDRAVPVAIGRRLLRHGVPPAVAATWVRWNRELYADLSGLLLGGPAVIGSLMDIIGRSPEATLAYSPRGIHPVPYLRALLSLELLRRMGFEAEADGHRKLWRRLFPDPRRGSIPRPLLDTFADVGPLVVDTVCHQPFAELGGKRLAEVLPFTPKEQTMVDEAAGRLATGADPGVVPERFLIGAARVALDRRLAPAEAVKTGFYKELARR